MKNCFWVNTAHLGPLLLLRPVSTAECWLHIWRAGARVQLGQELRLPPSPLSAWDSCPEVGVLDSERFLRIFERDCFLAFTQRAYLGNRFILTYSVHMSLASDC